MSVTTFIIYMRNFYWLLQIHIDFTCHRNCSDYTDLQRMQASSAHWSHQRIMTAKSSDFNRFGSDLTKKTELHVNQNSITELVANAASAAGNINCSKLGPAGQRPHLPSCVGILILWVKMSKCWLWLWRQPEMFATDLLADTIADLLTCCLLIITSPVQTIWKADWLKRRRKQGRWKVLTEWWWGNRSGFERHLWSD